MGFMDDLKKAAKDMGGEAKKLAAQGKEKVGTMQLKRQMDEAAKKLGYLIYRERTEGVPAGAEADQLIAEITRLQAEIDATPASPEGDGSEGTTPS